MNDDLNVNPIELKSGTSNRGNKSINFDSSPTLGDRALIQSSLLTPDSQVEVTNDDIEQAIVYGPDVTSIDFMMPEDERQIIEKDLNLYSDMDKMQKVLSVAKKNKKIREDIKTLELISKSGQLSNRIFDLMLDEKNLKVLEKYIQRKFEEGDIAKAYKEIGMMNKVMLDARQEMIKGLTAKKSNKNIKIGVQFTNDSGDEFQLGVDI